jgi:hypothetical protein
MMYFNNTHYDWGYVIESLAKGTSLLLHGDTSVFFENVNTNTDWYTAFQDDGNQISVNYAYEAGPSTPLESWPNEYPTMPWFQYSGSLVPNPWNPTGQMYWYMNYHVPMP